MLHHVSSPSTHVLNTNHLASGQFINHHTREVRSLCRLLCRPLCRPLCRSPFLLVTRQVHRSNHPTERVRKPTEGYGRLRKVTPAAPTAISPDKTLSSRPPHSSP